jgi:hypothetical protein
VQQVCSVRAQERPGRTLCHLSTPAVPVAALLALTAFHLCLQLVYKELEQQFADSYDAAEAARQLERQWLLQGGLDDYPCQPYATLRDQHSANILVVRWVPGGHQVVTGSGECGHWSPESGCMCSVDAATHARQTPMLRYLDACVLPCNT